MTSSRNPRRWAPWWAYLIPILAINYARQVIFPPADVGDAVSVALALATVALVGAVVTALYRSSRSTCEA